MQLLKEIINVDQFFERLAHARVRILMLDYDGTLAPFRPERDQAFPYAEVVDPINRISSETDTRIVLISGRAVADLVPLAKSLDPLPEIWGSHGWERLDTNGAHHPPTLPSAVVAALSLARQSALDADLLRYCEVKPTGIAAHWRGVDELQRKRIERSIRHLWTPLTANVGIMELHEFDGGVEIRAAAKNKGYAVRAILAEYDRPAAIAYAGDDRTDEDAFREIGSRGLCVLVRDELRPTLAHVWLRPPGELVEFLTRWRLACKKVE